MQPVPVVSLVLALMAVSTLFLTISSPANGSVGGIELPTTDVRAINSLSPAVTVSGGTSVLYLPFSILGNGQFVCTEIELYPEGNSRDVFITSRGLGVVQFTENPSLQDRNCNSKISGGTSGRLSLGDLTTKKQILLQIGPLDSSKLQSALTGTVSVEARSRKPVEISIRVEYPLGTSFWTALTWFFGVVIPAALTALLTYRVNGYLQRAAESRSKAANDAAALQAFQSENQAVLDQIFGVPYQVRFWEEGNDDAKFAQGLEKVFQNYQILAKLPPKEALRLRQRFDDGNRQAIIEELVRLLPQWSKKIQDPEKSEW